SDTSINRPRCGENPATAPSARITSPKLLDQRVHMPSLVSAGFRESDMTSEPSAGGTVVRGSARAAPAGNWTTVRFVGRSEPTNRAWVSRPLDRSTGRTAPPTSARDAYIGR